MPILEINYLKKKGEKNPFRQKENEQILGFIVRTMPEENLMRNRHWYLPGSHFEPKTLVFKNPNFANIILVKKLLNPFTRIGRIKKNKKKNFP